MSMSSTKAAREVMYGPDMDQLLASRMQQLQLEGRGRRIARIDRLWDRRKLLGKFVACGVAASVLIALLIPSRYSSTTRLMPPDPPATK